MPDPEVHHVATLGLRELSALTVCGGRGAPPRLLAVGDEDFAVVSAELDDESGTLVRTWRDDLRPALRDAGIDLRSGSGFEGVASDGVGTIVLLQEEQARLLVVTPDLSRLLHTLVLAVPVDDPVLNPAWRREPNSRGEGLLLLRRGHVLIAKERDAACLIEFGPPGDRPSVSRRTRSWPRRRPSSDPTPPRPSWCPSPYGRSARPRPGRCRPSTTSRSGPTVASTPSAHARR